MPLPSPRDDESQSQFIARCMGDERMRGEFPRQDQRVAVCHRQWRSRDRKEGPDAMVTKTLAATVRSAGLSELECEATMTTSSVDREGDVIDPAGWRLDRYMQCPVVLWGHDAKSLPVARVERISPTRDGLSARIQFAPPGVSARADELRGLVKAGIVSAVSVGFAPIRSQPRKGGGTNFMESELLELSFVSIPANPAALVTEKSAARGSDGLVYVLDDDVLATKAAKPECPRTPCRYDASSGRCGEPWDLCPFTAGIPTKGDPAADLADLPAPVRREMGERLVAIEASLRCPPPEEGLGRNMLASIDVLPATRARMLEKAAGITEDEIASAVVEVLAELKGEGRLQGIIDREVKAAHRKLWGL